MCGLIGAVTNAGDLSETRVRAALARLRHRGPDHQEAITCDLSGHAIWLGHTRLSIIDLNEEANQPMRSDDGRYALIFNGEIYNYIELRAELQSEGISFRTKSDTEVLLKCWERWGEGSLDKLDGMFAFAILDMVRQKLFCVRDAFGIKPFFYAIQNHRFFFSSEMSAILDLCPDSPKINLQRAYDYLVYADYDSNEDTFIDGVSHLMPAHVLTLDVSSGSIESIRRWWSPEIEKTSSLSFAEAAEAVRGEFLSNIRRQIRSDVALGAALSGGIDSSAVVCAIHHVEPSLPIHTFSYVDSDPNVSEEYWVDMVNKHVGALSHKVSPSSDELVRDLDEMVQAQGEPFGSTSVYAQYRVFQLARNSGVTVTLDGQGADELLAGYSGYAGYRVMSHLAERNARAALRFARAWHRWPSRRYSLIALDIARSVLPDMPYALAWRTAGRSTEPHWLNVPLLRASGIRLSELRLSDRAPKGRRVMLALRQSLSHKGLPGLLRHADRNAMHFSIESRVPFLTTRLCGLLYSLPEEFLISGEGETKSVFRAAMRGIVPDAILDRRDKVGFSTSEQRWLTSSAPKLRDWMQGASDIPFLNSQNAISLFDDVIAGRKPFSWQVWRLINLVRWWDTLPARVR